MGEVSLKIDGEPVPVDVRINPRAKRLILKVDPISGIVRIVVPNKSAIRDAMAFARRQNDWIAARRAECKPPIPMSPGTSVPLRGTDHNIVHEPSARRGVWLDADQCAIHVCGQIEHVPRRTLDWLKRQAKSDLSRCVTHHAANLGVSYEKISIRDTRSRWGSCSSSGTLSFSWRLILAPPLVLDYVAAHEVAHLKHHDHSPAFWAVVRDLTPHAGEATGWLNRHGGELHRFGKAG